MKTLVKLKNLGCSRAHFNELCFHEKRNRTIHTTNFSLSFKVTTGELERNSTGVSEPLLFQAAKLKILLLL